MTFVSLQHFIYYYYRYLVAAMLWFQFFKFQLNDVLIVSAGYLKREHSHTAEAITNHKLTDNGNQNDYA